MKSEIEIPLADAPVRLLAIISMAFVLAFTISGYTVTVAGYHWSAFSDARGPLRLFYLVFTLLLIPLGLLLLFRGLRTLGILALLVSAIGVCHFSSFNILGRYMEPEKAARRTGSCARPTVSGAGI